MKDKNLSFFTEELMKNIMLIRRGIMKTFFRLSGLGKFTIPQFSSLLLIESSGDLKMKDIAKELNISLPAATGMINRLYKIGMVKRVFDEKDRRIIRITLTPRGKAIIENMRNQHKKMIENVFGKLTKKERADYLKIVRKIKNIVNV